MRKFWFIKIPVMILLFISLVSTVLMLLWNWLMPDLFSLPEITFWQALGLLLLSKILFGLGKGGGPGRHGGPPWKKHFERKWHSIPEEQREKWKRRFADKWCPVEEPKNEEEKKEGT